MKKRRKTMAVSHVSLDDINLARESMPVVVESKPSKAVTTTKSKYFVDMLSDEKLKKFFSKYKSLGYVSHQRDEETKTIRVVCNDFENREFVPHEISQHSGGKNRNYRPLNGRERFFFFENFKITIFFC